MEFSDLSVMFHGTFHEAQIEREDEIPKWPEFKKTINAALHSEGLSTELKPEIEDICKNLKYCNLRDANEDS